MASTALCGADKNTETLLEVLRDVGGLQEQIKALQKSLDGKFADLNQAGAEQARAAAERSEQRMAAFSADLQKSLQVQQDQQGKTMAAVAALGSQMQAAADQLGTMRQAIGDLTAAMSRLTTQMTDLGNAVKAAQSAKPTEAAAKPELSATDLLAAADGDRLGGKLDLAIQEYRDYGTKFPDSPQASDAQYYVGSIHYSNQEWEEAVKSFDSLRQSYPDSKRVPESLYYKADSLAKMGRWQEANETLRDLCKRFPESPLAKQPLTVKQPK
jgi:TolA-binding protein